jgi:plastocyanin
MKKIVACSLFSLFLWSCGGDSTPTAPTPTPVATSTTSVAVSDDFFNPASIQVSRGVTVIWTWSSNRIHNVTFADNAITDSGDQGGGMYQTAMPTASGLYTYQCTVHAGMNGSVTVQ